LCRIISVVRRFFLSQIIRTGFSNQRIRTIIHLFCIGSMAVSDMRFDFDQLDSMSLHGTVNALPQITVFNRLITTIAPVVCNPAVEPFIGTAHNIVVVANNGHIRRDAKGFQTCHDSHQFHAIICRVGFCTFNQQFRIGFGQNCGVAT
jgi:hypothetical protein